MERSRQLKSDGEERGPWRGRNVKYDSEGGWEEGAGSVNRELTRINSEAHVTAAHPTSCYNTE